MSQWPVEIDGREYHPIPDSWLEHPRASDPDGKGPRCLAVSCAVTGSGRMLYVRYAHPVSSNVITLKTGACPLSDDDDDRVPCALLSDSRWSWPRSQIPDPEQSIDTLRTPERDHLRDLWADRLEDLDFNYEREMLDADPERRLVTDGGRSRLARSTPVNFRATACRGCGYLWEPALPATSDVLESPGSRIRCPECRTTNYCLKPSSGGML